MGKINKYKTSVQQNTAPASQGPSSDDSAPTGQVSPTMSQKTELNEKLEGSSMLQQRSEEEKVDDQWQQRPQKNADGQKQVRGTGAVPKGQPHYRQMPSRCIPRGTLGEKGKLGVNMVKMDLSNMPTVAYQYDISITPDRPKKLMRDVVDRFNKTYFKDHAMAYDGCHNIYTLAMLPVASLAKTVDILHESGRKMTFDVIIKKTDALEVDLNCLKWYQKERISDKPMKALQCLEVILSTPCHSKAVHSGRSFYTKPAESYDLSDGFEMWTGLFQAVILGDETFFNVDIANKSFAVESTLLDYLRTNYRMENLNQALNQGVAEGLRSYLTSMTVVYDPPPCFNSFSKSYMVLDVTKQVASRLYFKKDQNIEISVAKYYESRGFQLKFPHLNCVHVGARDKTIYLPIELLRIPFGQTLNKTNDLRQVQQMIQYSATSTDERKSRILRMLAYFNHNSDKIVSDFGIQIGAAFIEVPMRLLKPPYLEYYAGQRILPLNGSWRLSNSTKFLLTKKPAAKHKWAIIYSARSRTSIFVVGNFSKMILQTATKLNMSLQDKPTITSFLSIDDTLRQMKAEKYDLVIVVLPTNGITYADVKQKAELQLGILTQCIKEVTIERRLDENTVQNLMLKVNAKLNGTNHKIANPTVQLKNVMFMGGDVNHPSIEQRDMPSVVGVTATHDEFAACYNIQYRIQKPTVETIEDMESIVTHHLKVYFRHQKRYPDHIVYYRDGVSDGQFPIVKKIELTGIRAACNKVRIKPKLTCIIVVKRHHVRFFPPTKSDRKNKFNNVTPGTVVDQVIVHPNEVQFFMVSHQANQGTAKPTRYNVILDEANMDIDVIQSLTHHLCHMFPRCNRAVSYPAPVYLAHLVAFRGSVYLEGFKLTECSDLAFEYAKRKINEFLLQANPMYFI